MRMKSFVRKGDHFQVAVYDCKYEGCGKFGCSQERLLGLEPCRSHEMKYAGYAIAGIGLLAGAYTLWQWVLNVLKF